MHKLLVITLVISFFAVGAANAAAPKSWSTTAYAYDANNVPLQSALSDFAEALGVRLDVTKVSGELKGKMRTDSARDFLDRLALQFRFQWFVYNGTLYISPNRDSRSVRLEVSQDAVADLKQALTQVGLLDDRFGWGELPDEGVVIVSGPQKYVEFVRSLSKKKKKGDEKLDFMVFPLQYAFVDDRRVNYRGQTVVIPGIATILSDLLGSGSKVSPSSLVTSTNPQDSMQAVEKMNQIAQDGIAGIVDGGRGMQQDIMNGYQSGHKAKVRADTRNNAVLIYDDSDKEPMYRALINKLDVPRNLIEIDAVILDIDRTSISELGMRWQVGDGSGTALVNTSGADPFLAEGAASTVLIQDFGKFFAQVRALESKGNASLVANPSILTIENQLAVIDFNKTAYISTVGERVANVTPVTAGTSLQVVPRAINQGDERLIQLSLDIEDGGIEQSSTANTPNVSRGSISTQAVINVNQSLVVGGFNVEQNSDSVSKVPVLGNIPAIGKLFSYSSRSKSKQERLFIITPKLLGTEMNPTLYAADNTANPSKTIREVLSMFRDNSQAVDDIVQIFKPTTGQEITREKIENTLATLVDGSIPEGFTEQFPESKTSLSQICSNSDMIFDDQKLQWFSNDRYAVMIGVVSNANKKSRRFDEASCNSRDTLAVSVWPNALLDPGQKAEVLVALKIPESNDAPQRSSLLGQ